MNRKFGIEFECLKNSNLDKDTVFSIIKDAGFDSVFSNEYDINAVTEIREKAAKKL